MGSVLAFVIWANLPPKAVVEFEGLRSPVMIFGAAPMSDGGSVQVWLKDAQGVFLAVESHQDWRRDEFPAHSLIIGGTWSDLQRFRLPINPAEIERVFATLGRAIADDPNSPDAPRVAAFLDMMRARQLPTMEDTHE
jgi:hypothetical protein